MINLETIRERAQSEGVTTNLILKEHLHFLILDYFFKAGLFSHLVFQGGTALRIVYNGVRYSEDLDFVLKRKNKKFLEVLSKEILRLPGYMDNLLPFATHIQVKTQKATADFRRFYLILEIEALKLRDKTHIEVVNVPSYAHQTMILAAGDIPVHPAIVVETAQEIFSDKVVAVAARDYLKGRDIWDIYFLLNTLKISLNKEIIKMVRKKIVDYRLTEKEFYLKFKDNLSLLEKRGSSVLKLEMERFLPISYRKGFEKKYPDISRETLGVLQRVLAETK